MSILTDWQSRSTSSTAPLFPKRRANSPMILIPFECSARPGADGCESSVVNFYSGAVSRRRCNMWQDGHQDQLQYMGRVSCQSDVSNAVLQKLPGTGHLSADRERKIRQLCMAGNHAWHDLKSLDGVIMRSYVTQQQPVQLHGRCDGGELIGLWAGSAYAWCSQSR